MESNVNKCHQGAWEAKSADRTLFVRLQLGSVLELEQVVDNSMKFQA